MPKLRRVGGLGDDHDVLSTTTLGAIFPLVFFFNQFFLFFLQKVMASGMTTSTAERNRSCDTFYLDEAGLRTHPECDIVQDPNFGLLQVSGTRKLSTTPRNPLEGGRHTPAAAVCKRHQRWKEHPRLEVLCCCQA